MSGIAGYRVFLLSSIISNHMIYYLAFARSPVSIRIMAYTFTAWKRQRSIGMFYCIADRTLLPLVMLSALYRD